jgi:hypothetical protein
MRDAERRFQADYTKKTQTFAQERQQWTRSSQAIKDGSVEADLEKVRSGQASIADFKRVYHKDFHHYVDQLIGQQQNRKGQNQQGGIDPAFLNDVNQIKQQFHQMQTDAIDKELEVKEAEFTKKYPFADPAAAYMQAEAILDNKNQNGLKPEITSREWDAIWKAANDKQSERFKQYQSNLVKGQRTQNAKSRDVGAGGGIPGQAPVRPKNIKQATEMLMANNKDLEL